LERIEKKLIHSVGAVGKVELIPEPGQPYTGIFEGATNILLRISVAKAPDTKKTTADGADDNYVPGFGIKFLRDGVPSANLVSMYSVNGQRSWNYFANEFSNRVPPPRKGIGADLLAAKFATGQKEIGIIGLRPLAEYTEKGENRSNHPVFPYQLIWKPTLEAKGLFPDTYNGPFLDEFKKIKVGMNIYEVLAKAGPDKPALKIGTIKVLEAFTPSYFGDKELFFQHNYINYDFEMHPEWRGPLENEGFLRELAKHFHE